MQFRVKPFFFALLAAMAMVTGGCEGDRKSAETRDDASGRDGGPQSALKLDFWHYFSQDHLAQLNEIIGEFEQENPEIRINPVFQGRPQELVQKLNSSFAASPPNNPILSTVYESWTDDFVGKDYMDAVADHFDSPDGLTDEEREDIIEVFREANSWDGKMITMPFNKSIYVLYANMDQLASAGFTTAPATQSQLRDAVTKTTKAEGSRIQMYGLGVAPVSEAFTTLFFAAGGEYLDAQGNPSFDSAAGLAALTTLHQLQHPKKHLYVDPGYMSVPFGNRQIAMYIYSSASFPYIEKDVAGKFDWGAAPIPGGGEGSPRYLMQGTNVGIFKNHSEESRAAAWKFVKFLTNTENAVTWATRTGYMPIRYSVVNHPRMQEYMEDNLNYATASSLVLKDMGKQEPKMAVWEGVREDLNSMVDRVLNRGADPKTELAATQARVAEKMRAWRK